MGGSGAACEGRVRGRGKLSVRFKEALGEPTPRFADPRQCLLEHDLHMQVRS